ncbi:MAG: hypothetical protein HQ557_00775 [Bacteroidetes bacterium]|nr:hypothetical protein [Bacteroidota bacterium]
MTDEYVRIFAVRAVGTIEILRIPFLKRPDKVTGEIQTPEYSEKVIFYVN